MMNVIKKINEELITDVLCVPPYPTVNGKFLHDYSEQQPEQKKFFITKEIISPIRRALCATYHYRELDIFKEVRIVIEYAIIAFYDNNPVCSYLSLLAVIETLLWNWHGEISTINRRQLKIATQDISIYIKSQFSDNSEYDQRILLLTDYLERAINIGWSQGDTAPKKDFNRNLSLHYLKNINEYSINLLNNCRALLIIDVIADLYCRTHPDKYKKLQSLYDLEYNQPLFELYAKYYQKLSARMLEGAQGNFIQNVLLKDNITRAEAKRIIDLI